MRKQTSYNRFNELDINKDTKEIFNELVSKINGKDCGRFENALNAKHIIPKMLDDETGDSLTHAIIKSETLNENEKILFLKTLIKYGSLMNNSNKSGITPLHLATGNQEETVVKFLLENGADVNAQDYNLKTPLHYAVVGKPVDKVPEDPLFQKSIKYEPEIKSLIKANINCLEVPANFSVYKKLIITTLFNFNQLFKVEIDKINDEYKKDKSKISLKEHVDETNKLALKEITTKYLDNMKKFISEKTKLFSQKTEIADDGTIPYNPTIELNKIKTDDNFDDGICNDLFNKLSQLLNCMKTSICHYAHIFLLLEDMQRITVNFANEAEDITNTGRPHEFVHRTNSTLADGSASPIPVPQPAVGHPAGSVQRDVLPNATPSHQYINLLGPIPIQTVMDDVNNVIQRILVVLNSKEPNLAVIPIPDNINLIYGDLPINGFMPLDECNDYIEYDVFEENKHPSYKLTGNIKKKWYGSERPPAGVARGVVPPAQRFHNDVRLYRLHQTLLDVMRKFGILCYLIKSMNVKNEKYKLLVCFYISLLNICNCVVHVNNEIIRLKGHLDDINNVLQMEIRKGKDTISISVNGNNAYSDRQKYAYNKIVDQAFSCIMETFTNQIFDPFKKLNCEKMCNDIYETIHNSIDEINKYIQRLNDDTAILNMRAFFTGNIDVLNYNIPENTFNKPLKQFIQIDDKMGKFATNYNFNTDQLTYDAADMKKKLLNPIKQLDLQYYYQNAPVPVLGIPAVIQPILDFISPPPPPPAVPPAAPIEYIRITQIVEEPTHLNKFEIPFAMISQIDVFLRLIKCWILGKWKTACIHIDPPKKNEIDVVDKYLETFMGEVVHGASTKLLGLNDYDKVFNHLLHEINIGERTVRNMIELQKDFTILKKDFHNLYENGYYWTLTFGKGINWNKSLISIVKRILEKNGNPNITDNTGNTAIVDAIRVGNTEAIRMLEKKTNVMLQNHANETFYEYSKKLCKANEDNYKILMDAYKDEIIQGVINDYGVNIPIKFDLIMDVLLLYLRNYLYSFETHGYVIGSVALENLINKKIRNINQGTISTIKTNLFVKYKVKRLNDSIILDHFSKIIMKNKYYNDFKRIFEYYENIIRNFISSPFYRFIIKLCKRYERLLKPPEHNVNLWYDTIPVLEIYLRDTAPKRLIKIILRIYESDDDPDKKLTVDSVTDYIINILKEQIGILIENNSEFMEALKVIISFYKKCCEIVITNMFDATNEYFAYAMFMNNCEEMNKKLLKE
jgi:ankyrin repeat protein